MVRTCPTCHGRNGYPIGVICVEQEPVSDCPKPNHFNPRPHGHVTCDLCGGVGRVSGDAPAQDTIIEVEKRNQWFMANAAMRRKGKR